MLGRRDSLRSSPLLGTRYFPGFVEHFNESVNFQQAVEDYKKRFGYYPEAVLADQIYRNRDNRAYCKKHGIRLSGPALERSKAGEAKKAERLEIQDMSERNAVEGGPF